MGIEEEEEEEVENSGVEGIEDGVEEEGGRGGGSDCVTGVWVVFGFGFVSVGVGVASMGSMEGEEGALLGACVSASFRSLLVRYFLMVFIQFLFLFLFFIMVFK